MTNQARKKMIASAVAGAPRKRILAYTVAAHQSKELLSPTAQVASALERLEVQDHSCGSCNTRMTASAELPSPVCVGCGSDTTPTGGRYMTQHASADSQLTAVQCVGCGAPTVMHASVFKQLAGRMTCPSCGTQCAAVAPAKTETPQGDDVDHSEVNDHAAGQTQPEKNEPVVKSKKTASKLHRSFFDDEDDGGIDELDGMDDLGDLAVDDGDLDIDDGLDLSMDTDAGDPLGDDMSVFDGIENDLDLSGMGDLALAVPEVPAPNPVITDVDQLSFDDAFGGSTQNLMSADDGSMHMDMPVTVGVDQRIAPANDLMLASFELPENTTGLALMDTQGLDDTAKAAYFVSAGSKLMLMKGHYCVATLTQERAKQNASVMHTDTFSEIVMNHVRDHGLRKAIASFGFQPVMVKESDSAAIQTQVAAVKKRLTASVAEKEAVRADAFALAAVGFARSGWANQPNPLRDAFARELAAHGAVNAEALSKRLFAQHGVEFASALCQVATQLAEKTPEARQHLAAAMQMVNAEALAEDDEPDDDSDNKGGKQTAMSLSARLSTPARPAPQRAALLQPALVTATADSTANAMLAGQRPMFSL